MKMKRLAKWALGVAGGAFLLGLCLYGAGTFLGGRAEGERAIARSVGAHWHGEGPGQSGTIDLGGEHGIHIGRDGIHVGGEHGIHIGRDSLDWDDGEELEDLDTGSLAGVDLAAFTDIEAELHLGDVIVEEGETYGVCLEWNIPTLGKAFDMTYENKNGKLKIWTEEGSGDVVGPGTWVAKATVTIPKGAQLGEVELSTEFGDISWSAEAAAREAELSTNLGDVDCAGLAATELKAESDLGDVTVDFPASEGVSYSLSTDLGEARVNGESAPAVYEAPHESYYVEVKSDLGNVELNF